MANRFLAKVSSRALPGEQYVVEEVLYLIADRKQGGGGAVRGKGERL
jgi:hypothetical protein